MDYIIFLVSLAVLIYGADIIISQSEKIALRFGISEYVIGATLIALGTSLPEMAASINASYNGHFELAVSNIIGSNILNIALVLGIVLLIAKKVKPHRDFFAKDSSWALFPVLILIVIIQSSNYTEISTFNGFALLALMGGYLLFLIKHDKETIELDSKDKEEAKEEFNWLKSIIFIIGGFLAVVYGADYMVSSATNIAKSLGVSQWIIGVVLVSLGTSTPELVVSVVAAYKNKADMAVGNIIGSNMANISVALGTAAVVNPIKLDFTKYNFDITVMLIATLMLIFITANKMYSKASGISLLVLLAIFLNHIASSVS
jgi:cation:H+ antiporter